MDVCRKITFKAIKNTRKVRKAIVLETSQVWKKPVGRAEYSERGRRD